MSGIIILFLFLLCALLLLSNVTATVSVTNDYFHAEIDCSVVKLILDNSKDKSRQKRKFKKKKKPSQRLSALLSLPVCVNFLLARSSVTINSLEVPTRASDPYELFTRLSLLHSATSLTLSFLLSRARELNVPDGAIKLLEQSQFSYAFSIDFTMVFALYNLILFGLIFLFESIKRRIKNARKQNE